MSLLTTEIHEILFKGLRGVVLIFFLYYMLNTCNGQNSKLNEKKIHVKVHIYI